MNVWNWNQFNYSEGYLFYPLSQTSQLLLLQKILSKETTNGILLIPSKAKKKKKKENMYHSAHKSYTLKVHI